MTYDYLWAVPALVLTTGVVLWLIVRWQHGALLHRLSERDRLSDEKLDANLTTVKALIQASIDAEAMTGRLVTGIAETLIPTLQYLNADVKELNALLHEMRASAEHSATTISALIERAESSDQRLTGALEELITLRSLAESAVAEQSRRLKAIDIALDFLSSRVQDLRRAPQERLPVETNQPQAPDGSEPLSEGASTKPNGDLAQLRTGAGDARVADGEKTEPET